MMLGAFEPPPVLGPSATWRHATVFLDDRIARHLVLQVLDAQDDTYLVVEQGRAWASTSGLLVTVDSDCVRLGFGIRSGLSRGARLQAALAEVNQSTRLGHVWLAEGRDDRSWSVIWGAVAPYSACPRHGLQRLVFSCTRACADASLRTRFATFGGQEYWATMVDAADDPLVAARVLWEHLA